MNKLQQELTKNLLKIKTNEKGYVALSFYYKPINLNETYIFSISYIKSISIIQYCNLLKCLVSYAIIVL